MPLSSLNGSPRRHIGVDILYKYTRKRFDSLDIRLRLYYYFHSRFGSVEVEPSLCRVCYFPAYLVVGLSNFPMGPSKLLLSLGFHRGSSPTS